MQKRIGCDGGKETELHSFPILIQANILYSWELHVCFVLSVGFCDTMYYKYNFCKCIANSLTVTHEALNPVDLVIRKVHVSLCCHLSVKRFVRKGIPSELRTQVTEQGYCMTLYSIFIFSD